MKNKLKATADDRIRRAENCSNALNKIRSAMLNIMETTSKTRGNVTHSVQKIYSRSTSENLRAARGFGMNPESTFYQGGHKKKSNTRSNKKSSSIRRKK